MERSGELDPTLQLLLESHSLPSGLGRKVAEQAFAKRFGSTLPRQVEVPGLTWAALPWLLVAALSGALMGYTVLPSQGGLSTQLMAAQMLGGRGGDGLGFLSTTILPASTATFRVVFLIFLILFVTRTRAWKRIYPRRTPMVLLMAQWLALLAALLGAARVLSGLYLAVMLFGDPFSGIRRGESAVGVAMLVDQMWWLAFWLAALATLLVVINLWMQYYLQPQSNDKS